MIIEQPSWTNLTGISDEEGSLRILELPFHAKRTYFIQGVPQGLKRGFHAHRSLRQIFFAPQGSFDLELTTPFKKETFVLNAADRKALIVPPGYWRVISNFTGDATCMVLASHHYDEEDYIRNFDDYVLWFNENFTNES